ncbi:CHAD domain-containing protein [Sphingobium scionense]
MKRKGKHLAKRSDERRHQARIAAKKLRYASEFFAPLFPKNKPQRRHAAFSAMLEKLQDDLGDSTIWRPRPSPSRRPASASICPHRMTKLAAAVCAARKRPMRRC